MRLAAARVAKRNRDVWWRLIDRVAAIPPLPRALCATLLAAQLDPIFCCRRRRSVAVRRHFSCSQRHHLCTSLHPLWVIAHTWTLASSNRCAAAEVGQGEGRAAISTVHGTIEREKGLVLRNGEQLAGSRCPTNWAEIEAKHADVSNERLFLRLGWYADATKQQQDHGAPKALCSFIHHFSYLKIDTLD